jgi:glutaconate CoA-transferase subunit B
MSEDFTLAEMIVVAVSEGFRNNGELLASGITVLPRIGAGLAKLTHSPELMMTDGEAYFVEEPVPLGPRKGPLEGYTPKFAGWAPYNRTFDVVWRGKRHAVINPIQIDRWGQTNLSGVGDPKKPKIQMQGPRGLPGNSINHINSMITYSHDKKVFVEGECDMAGGAGYNPKRWAPGVSKSFLDVRNVFSNLCVFDYSGPEHAARLKHLHPGVTFEEVQAATGFPLIYDKACTPTPAPTAEQLAIIRKLDPHNLRATMLKDNPPGVRA